MYKKKDHVIFKSTKSKDPNVKWIRKIGTILEITSSNGYTTYNIHVDEDGTIESVLINAVESKTS